MKILYKNETIEIKDEDADKVCVISNNGAGLILAVKYIKDKYGLSLMESRKCYNDIIENYDNEKASKLKEILS